MGRTMVFFTLGFAACVAIAGNEESEWIHDLTPPQRARPKRPSHSLGAPADMPADWFVPPGEDTDREMAVIPTGRVATAAEIHSFTIDRAQVSELAYTDCVTAKRCK